MAGWSLSSLANQAEAFLEQVDRQAATSLGEEAPKEKNIFSSLNSTATTLVNTPLPDLTTLSDDEDSLSLPDKEEDPPSNETPSEQSEVAERAERVNEVTMRLMKQELQSVSEEMRSYQSRFKQYQSDVKLLERQNEGLMSQLRENERRERGLRDKEEDLSNAIMAKDAQLGVLKVQLAETHAQVNSQLDVIESMQSLAAGEGKLQQRIVALEEQIVQEKTRRGDVEVAHSAEVEALNENLRALEGTVQERNVNVLTEKRRATALLIQLQQAKKGIADAEEDLAKYKERATRILQSKDSKEKSSGDVVDIASLEQAITERVEVERKLTSSVEEVGELRALLNNIDRQHQQELDESCKARAVVEDRVRLAEYRVNESQALLTATQQELTQTRVRLEETQRQLSRCNTESVRVERVEQPSGQLQHQLQGLTEVLLTKQSECEALHSEKSSLVLQLESMEHTIQIQELKHKNSSHNSNHNNVLSQSNQGNHSTRKLREAVHTIDKFSIRLGVFLRRYPAARMMVIGYMGLLHVWVMVVLLTYSPEVHTTEMHDIK